SSYGLTNCAERTAIFKAVSEGEKKLLAIAIAAKASTPCGACRQVMSEFASADMPVYLVNMDEKTGKNEIIETTLGALLPLSFNKEEAGLL
ncbi:MAG: cytidine deaminase, partial [Elusimicrobiales bacterium]|nr:cytidine deaminase [Elusimicrobiales bacterium]